MTTLPITRMILYKHGVGFFERRAQVEGDEVSLSFRVEEMNDILKSLTAVDWGDGQVLGVDYATPQSREERLAGCSIRLGDARSLRDLLIGLRGRRVELHLDQGETAVGLLLGLDELPDRQPVGDSLVSLLQDQSSQVQTVALSRVQSVTIHDERGAADLRFFLQVAQTQEDYREVIIRLTAGAHDLSVSYIAPAPTWRVSYRLVADPDADGGPIALLLGWGIFDNRLEEELEDITLSLVAGMPISFVYDLYTPFTPERPFIEEEARTAAGPVDFLGATTGMGVPLPPAAPMPVAMAAMDDLRARAPQAAKMSRRDLQEATAVQTSGESLGELFQYHINTPVSVGRGQSAMVPIVAANLPYRKDLLYNGAKLAAHPVASLRLDNKTSLTLERGPVTVLEGGDYVGEAVLPFTADEAEFIIPYAVELGARVREQSGAATEIYGLSLQGAYLVFEEWDIRWREYQINNTTNRPLTILVEHPRQASYDLFDTPEPAEQTEDTYRFAVDVPARRETTLRVNTRYLRRRQEQIERQSYVNLQRFLRQGLIDRATHDLIATILGLLEKIGDHQKRLEAIKQERQKIYEAQKQIQGNMQALSNTGKEGQMRAQYVDRLEETEQNLQVLAQEEGQLVAEIKRLEKEIERRLQG
ncbi:MAG: hypothetical protein KBE23_22035 [Chloroflexi bacterium]|nr:hypothetical protein [Chloroflexota bacterium]MBP7045446.1 hypothetical protein [Chloroflexota bacterium]